LSKVYSEKIVDNCVPFIDQVLALFGSNRAEVFFQETCTMAAIRIRMQSGHQKYQLMVIKNGSFVGNEVLRKINLLDLEMMDGWLDGKHRNFTYQLPASMRPEKIGCFSFCAPPILTSM
jgi:hypothetical protein